ncbi:MAG: polyprenyl synthetase family protein [Bacteroidales bacterium]|jgi:octaprenyl-diphosphate synthase|nr:polyprenyl synthetase family protein [Bacteroidales bacterium]
MSSTIKQISRPVSDELKMFNQRFRCMLKSDVFLLNLITCYILKTKGKQLRPTLVMLSAKMFGEIGEKTYAAAALIELLHTTSLVHDDVVDEANERRGFFPVHTLWNSKTAVLFGDYLLAQGLILSVDNRAFDLLHIVSVAVKEMCEGELLQLEHSRKQNITRDEYFKIIRKKTAALIAACVEAGAQSSGATLEQIAQMRQFGLYLGMIFQIKDDLLDYQPAGITGKAAGNDLKEKKYTLPLIYVLEQSSPDERKRIVRTVNSEAPFAEKLQMITRLIAEYKGIDHCYAVMDELGKKATAMLDTLPQNEASAMLVKAVGYVTKREK